MGLEKIYGPPDRNEESLAKSLSRFGVQCKNTSSLKSRGIDCLTGNSTPQLSHFVAMLPGNMRVNFPLQSGQQMISFMSIFQWVEITG